MPFFGRHLRTEHVTLDSRCSWYAPMRIDIKHDTIMFHENLITLDRLTHLLQTNHKLFFDPLYEDQRLSIHWNDSSLIKDRKAVLELITTEIGNIYTEFAKTFYNKDIVKLNAEEIKHIRQYNFSLYQNFNKPKKLKASPPSPPILEF